ncbi:2-dehydro-3-deoxygalactonokinase [Profundibacterium mesophilum]|uniref:2-dehydro-3-deoxygalactonate kinase n=1 Tax=Profundibacterium mesophilum KAUST100406-0324 TaxID=1037889 RepID=A0A921NR25_9RHOB|nr:2-dehydro-3-deoxygalactonokinase [Profundibacterium mesophilum]KAF0674569.1 2-dehydro-3-deoxygalactonate kinase [Profundibacterium mesophilum KAUST100406-0324]
MSMSPDDPGAPRADVPSADVPSAVDFDWIGIDWGTSNLRAWAMDAGGSVLAQRQSDKGMGCLSQSQFAPVLLELIAPWRRPGRRVQVIAAGMVGSRQGWIEAPYSDVPTQPLAAPPVTAPIDDAQVTVHVIPGLRQRRPADVMRGEETQIAGFLLHNPDFDGVICLPGSHGKWARISAGEVVSFRTAMTGELHAAIGGHTVLRHTLGMPGRDWPTGVFEEAVADGLSRPEALAVRLFELRAEELVNGQDAGTAQARLSGLLIGAELGAMRPYWLGQQVALIGSAELSARYTDALAAQGSSPIQTRGDAMTRAGLLAARRNLEETSR